MRRLWKMRKVFLPQAVAFLFIAAAILCSPTVGMSRETEKAVTKSGAEGVMITTTEENQTVSRAASSEAGKQAQADDAAGVPKNVVIETAGTVYGLDPSVKAALAHMGLKEEHIDLWSGEHPRTTLKNLRSMSKAMQSKVANVATFIRKVNKQVSPKTAWREACALVYYSKKYKVPTDLVVGVAKAESRFNPSAQSRGGALGVMQVLWKVHNGMLSKKGIATKRDHMFDPERGVEAGVMIMSRYIAAYGTVQKALNRYYGGIATVYLRQVNKNLAMFQSHSSATGF
jgi:hypothetical protein